jgi:hypothetical protein
MTEEMKQRCIKALRTSWDTVAYDVLKNKDFINHIDSLPGGDPRSSATREEVIEIALDQMYIQGGDKGAAEAMEQLTFEDQNTIAKEAFSNELYCY